MLHINIYLWGKQHVATFHEIEDGRNYYRIVRPSVHTLHPASATHSNLNLLVPLKEFKL